MAGKAASQALAVGQVAPPIRARRDQNSPATCLHSLPANRTVVIAAVRSRGNAATELRLIAVFRARGITGRRRRAVLLWKVESAKSKPSRVRPDFVFRAPKLAVFVDGCFWHGCALHATQPKTNADFWRKNVARQRGDGHTGGVAPKG